MANENRPNESLRYISREHESVPALEVPLSISHRHEDELLAWLQYPVQDSFDQRYCSEDPCLEGLQSHSDILHDAFSNLTLREATHTWGVSEVQRGKRNLAANEAMAMGARRAAGLLFQSGADAFNKVRTNAQPPVTGGAHDRTTGERRLLTRAGPFQEDAALPNFSMFSRACRALELDSGKGVYNILEATQKCKLGFGSCVGNSNSHNAGTVATEFPSQGNVEQSSTIPDSSAIIKETPSLCLWQNRVSGLASQHDLDLGFSSSLMNEAHMIDGVQWTEPSLVSSGLEGGRTFDLATNGSLTSSNLTSLTSSTVSSLHTKRCFSSQFSPSDSCCLDGLFNDPKLKRIKTELETRHRSS